jgi:glutaredoxin
MMPPDPATDEIAAPDEEPRGRAVLGTLALAFSAVLVCAAFVDETGGLPFAMPRSWYVNRPLWYGMALLAFIAGWRLLRDPRSADANQSPFRRVIVYTRQGCHLCADALAVLERYAAQLPAIETIDVDSDPKLVELHGENVPVIEIDGRVRFRHRVNEVLLRRMLERRSVRSKALEEESA